MKWYLIDLLVIVLLCNEFYVVLQILRKPLTVVHIRVFKSLMCAICNIFNKALRSLTYSDLEFLCLICDHFAHTSHFKVYIFRHQHHAINKKLVEMNWKFPLGIMCFSGITLRVTISSKIGTICNCWMEQKSLNLRWSTNVNLTIFRGHHHGLSLMTLILCITRFLSYPYHYQAWYLKKTQQSFLI